MAQDSRNLRKKRRIRRNMSLLTRSNIQLDAELGKTYTLLLAVLAQNGGEITVTKSTMQQVIEHIKELSWQTSSGANENEFVVRMVTKVAEEPAPVGYVEHVGYVEQPEQVKPVGPVLPLSSGPDHAEPTRPTDDGDPRLDYSLAAQSFADKTDAAIVDSILKSEQEKPGVE